MHQNPVVDYRTGDPPALTVVLVHGRTLTPCYMRGLAERLALPGIRYVLPAADGSTWFPKPFLAPVEDNERICRRRSLSTRRSSPAFWLRGPMR
jgi:phospholipase/carboxylesterase